MTLIDPDADVPGRPFTKREATQADVATMGRMLAHLRRHLDTVVVGSTIDRPTRPMAASTGSS
jgi:Ser/Thr protein kinase RdoA (MazF antagonist)